MRCFVDVAGIRTHYLEAGAGPTVVLLHSGEFGAAAELSWEFTIGPLSEHFRVVAPDWLGFGLTDKLFDFGPGGLFSRRVDHIRRFLEALRIDEADFIGNSMGGTFLLQVSAMAEPIWPVRRQVIISGGGTIVDNEARRATLDYDCTAEAMRRIVTALFHDPKWSADDEYIERRRQMSLVPGAWQCSAAARFKAPMSVEPPGIALSGPEQEVALDHTKVATLLIAGEQDALREPGYADVLRSRIPGSQLLTVAGAGHCPHIEQADLVNAAICSFLRGVR